jgi:pseudouridylate synthase / pseudouridine kinase
MDAVIAQALGEAEELGVSGSDNTPFILKRIRILTQGDTVAANRSLIEANVIRGTKVALELAAIELQHREKPSR